MTLFNPFDVPLRADVAERLEMTIEEFLMPTAVQDIGVIQVITYDKREGVFRAIDQINFDNLVTRSGALTKLQDVQVTSTMTGRTDQTYTFNFQAQHKVPLNGFFSIIISETASKGVMITDAETVEKNCNLIEGTTAKGLECKTGQTQDGRYFVNITCSQSGFGPYGTSKGDSFKFRIKGLTNPRTRNLKRMFKLYTMD